MLRCIDCGFPRIDRDARCDECRRIHDAARGTQREPSILPPREPLPESLPYCRCGALGGLLTVDGLTSCPNCRRAA